MKKYFLTVAALFLAILMGGCDLFNQSEKGHGEIERVNFEPGTVYTYSRMFMMTDSTFTDTLEIVASDTVQVSVHREYEIEGLINTLRFETIDIHTGSLSETWYLHSEDKFIELAHRNAGLNPPVQPKIAGYEGVNIESIGPVPSLISQLTAAKQAVGNELTDKLIFREDPRIVYQYPMHEGKSWISFIDPFKTTRTVLEIDAMVFSGRDQFLARIRNDIQLYGDFFGGLNIEERIGEDGMHSRVIKSVQMGMRPFVHKDPMPGYFYIVDNTELISIDTPD